MLSSYPVCQGVRGIWGCNTRGLIHRLHPAQTLLVSVAFIPVLVRTGSGVGGLHPVCKQVYCCAEVLSLQDRGLSSFHRVCGAAGSCFTAQPETSGGRNPSPLLEGTCVPGAEQ